MAATIATGLVILSIALFAAFARPVLHPTCPVSSYFTNQSTEAPSVEATTPEIATNGKRFPWQDILLPKDVVPESYHIFIHPNLTESWFRGKVEMHLLVKKPTNFIVFHLKEMNITCHSLKFDNAEAKEIKILEDLQYKKFEQYYLGLDETLTKDQRVVLTVEFSAPLVSKLAGLYKSTYQTKNNETRHIATTHFEATDARAAFPCFDEPELKAKFSLSMVRDRDHISLFNMPLEETVPYAENDSLMVDRFQESVKMSTYLVAFVVCDFANLTAYTESGVMVRVFAPPDVIQQANFALDTAVKILDHYDTFFGIKYPLPKQDLIAVPDFAAGAMENWGLITYRTTTILYDPTESSSAAQQWVAIVVAHELAHQWFGNLVTMKWWNDLWLNEGFASFVEYLGADSVHPEWKLYDQFVSTNLLGALNLDSLSNSHPIQVPVHNPNQINEIFDSISYDKGSSILRMLQNVLGMEKFKSGLHNYLQKYSYANTQTVDLWNALSEVYTAQDLDVKTIMDTWTQQMGYPVVSLSRIGNKIEATQERFLLYSGDTMNKLPSKYDYKWYIPLSYASSEDLSPSSFVWMNMSSASFTVPPQTTWIKANYEMYGFYRVNYDIEMWNHLIDVMKSNHQVFSGGDRAGLIDDAFALSRSEHIPVIKALEMSRYLVHETDYVPWSAAVDNLAYIGYRLEDTTAYGDFKEYFLNLLTPVIGRLGWDDKGTHLEKFLRQLVLREAVYLGHDSAVPEGKSKFDQWMNSGKSVEANLKSVIYQAGVQYGGSREWDFCWQKYKETHIASEKKLLLHALSASQNTQILSRYLEFSLDPDKIRAQDCASVISGVAMNPAGRLLAWRFVRKNWDTILKKMGSGLFTGSRIIRSVASSFSSQFDYDEVETFFKQHEVGSGERAVKQALESIRMNMEWLARNKKDVAGWLHIKKNTPQNL